MTRGIETLLSAEPNAEPAKTIALALLSGFAFMLLVEQLSSGHAHAAHGHSFKQPHSPRPALAQIDDQYPPRGASGSNGTLRPADEEFDLDLDLAGAEEEGRGLIDRRSSQAAKTSERARALPLTLGLVIHSLADGLALGASALATTGEREDEDGDSSGPNVQLSLIVFVALVMHKGLICLLYDCE